VQYAAEKASAISHVFTPVACPAQVIRTYPQHDDEARHTPDSESIIISCIPYVAETEASGRGARATISCLLFPENLLRTSDQMNTPPGYLPVERLAQTARGGRLPDSEITVEALTSVYRTVLGTLRPGWPNASPFGASRPRAARFVVHLHAGDMPTGKAVKNITLFAEEVIPRLRLASCRPLSRRRNRERRPCGSRQATSPSTARARAGPRSWPVVSRWFNFSRRGREPRLR